MVFPADGGILTGERLLTGKRSIGEKSGGIVKIDAAKVWGGVQERGKTGELSPPLEKDFAREAAAAL